MLLTLRTEFEGGYGREEELKNKGMNLIGNFMLWKCGLPLNLFSADKIVFAYPSSTER